MISQQQIEKLSAIQYILDAPSDNSKTPDLMIKCIVVGSAMSGKSSFRELVCDQLPFNGEYVQTFSVEIRVLFRVGLGNQRVKFQIWDTGSDPRYASLRLSLYIGASCCLIFYSVASRESFEAVPKYLSEAR